MFLKRFTLIFLLVCLTFLSGILGFSKGYYLSFNYNLDYSWTTAWFNYNSRYASLYPSWSLGGDAPVAQTFGYLGGSIGIVPRIGAGLILNAQFGYDGYAALPSRPGSSFGGADYSSYSGGYSSNLLVGVGTTFPTRLVATTVGIGAHYGYSYETSGTSLAASGVASAYQFQNIGIGFLTQMTFSPRSAIGISVGLLGTFDFINLMSYRSDSGSWSSFSFVSSSPFYESSGYVDVGGSLAGQLQFFVGLSFNPSSWRNPDHSPAKVSTPTVTQVSTAPAPPQKNVMQPSSITLYPQAAPAPAAKATPAPAPQQQPQAATSAGTTQASTPQPAPTQPAPAPKAAAPSQTSAPAGQSAPTAGQSAPVYRF